MSSYLDATTASHASNFTANDVGWQVGASGKTNNTGTTQLFQGYIHAICLFSDTLTQQEIDDLSIYFSNKFRAKVVN